VLKQDLESKQAKVVNLDALTAQLEDIKQSFGDMLKRLPNKTGPSGRHLAAGVRGWPGIRAVQARQRAAGRFLCGAADPDPGHPGAITSSVSSSVASPIFHASSRNTTSISPLINRVGGLVMESTAKTYRYLGDEEDSAGTPALVNRKPAS
jgi:type IV pilus assembly protein PilO